MPAALCCCCCAAAAVLQLLLVSYYGYCNFVSLNGSLRFVSALVLVRRHCPRSACTESANALWGLKFIMKAQHSSINNNNSNNNNNEITIVVLQLQYNKYARWRVWNGSNSRDSGTGDCGDTGIVVWGTEIAAGLPVQLGWTTKPLVRFKFN